MGFAKGKRVTGQSRAQLASDLTAQYEQGASIRSLAEHTGRSHGFIHQVLAEALVTLRDRGGPHGRAHTS